MKKTIYFFTFLIIGSLFLSGCWLIDMNQRLAVSLVPNVDKNNEVLLQEAKSLFVQKKNSFSAEQWAKGPCLGKMNDQWVVDIVHDPRLPMDDDPANQCQDYSDGKIKHFFELDPDGNLVLFK